MGIEGCFQLHAYILNLLGGLPAREESQPLRVRGVGFDS